MKRLERKIVPSRSSVRAAKWISLTALVLAGSFSGLVYFSEKPSVEVDDGFLTIKSLFYGKRIAVGDIRVNDIRPLDLNNDAGYAVKWRTNGIGLPGYHVGWMKLDNGNKALVYLTDNTNVVLIPTNDYDILISASDSAGMTEALHKTLNK